MTNQTSLFIVCDRTLEAAQTLIKNYVKRGDPMSSLRDMGASSPDSYSVCIGGYLDGKRYNNDWILVARDMDGKKVSKVYKLKEVYDDLKD